MDKDVQQLIDRLLDDNARLQSENDQLRSALDHYEMRMEQAAEKIADLDARLARHELARWEMDPEFVEAYPSIP